MIRKNIVLIDYENVQKNNLDLLFSAEFEVYVFVGQDQNKIQTDLIISAQKFGDRLKWIKISGNGPNALDFHIAYYIGKISRTEENVFFHIISKDKGFDPLIVTLKNENVLCMREITIEEIPLIKAKTVKNPEEMVAIIIEKIIKGSKPRTKKTLNNLIFTTFGKQISDDQIGIIVSLLIKKKEIEIKDDNKIEYMGSNRRST